MSKIKIGVIGIGMAFERLHYPAFQQLSDKFEIAAICDLEEEKTKKWQNTLGLTPQDIYSDYQQMIQRDDLDAFDIIVPIELNYEITKNVAKMGKPIICEKPLAPTKEQIEAARKLPNKYNIPIMIAENYRYNDEINIIKSLVDSEEIGSIYYFIQNRVVNTPQDMLKNKFPAKEWRHHPEYPGGVFYDTAVHDIGALQHIFGSINKVQAFGVEEDRDFSPYSVIQTNLLFDSNITGQFTFFCSGKEMQRPFIGLRIFGTEGMIFLEERDCGVINVAYNDGNTNQLPYQPQMGFYHELLNFYNAITGKETISVTPEIEFGDARTMFAIMDSIQNQEIVNVKEEFKKEPVF